MVRMDGLLQDLFQDIGAFLLADNAIKVLFYFVQIKLHPHLAHLASLLQIAELMDL